MFSKILELITGAFAIVNELIKNVISPKKKKKSHTLRSIKSHIRVKACLPGGRIDLVINKTEKSDASDIENQRIEG